jgi:YidC/Oxa1 family membrane protein insertase
MNKTEKIICMLLVVALAGYLFFNARNAGRSQKAASSSAPVAVQTVKSNAPEKVSPTVASSVPAEAAPAAPSVPEVSVSLENSDLSIELSTWGAAVKKAVLKRYSRDCGEIGEGNPPLEFDFSAGNLGGLSGAQFSGAGSVFKIVESSSNRVVFANGALTRTVTLESDYRIAFKDVFASPSASAPNAMSLGVMSMGTGKNDLLSVDSWQMNAKGGEVIHHSDDDSPLKPYLVGGIGGCSGSSSAAGMPRVIPVEYPSEQKWIALKNRFFVSALVSSSMKNDGFSATVERDMKSRDFRPTAISAAVRFASVPAERESVFYVGPKQQSLLWDLGGGKGMKDVMEFGMWSWICYPIVYLLNLFNDYIPGYGIAIILLTLLVRIIFWPLTHKSTVGMRKMQEIQPKMKELQAKFKDNPQRMQQEIWALYRTEKVNPMSSCLPMLVQIPVFIALFNVLRSTVELRYAPFLWIADLSEPEGLFANVLPFGGLNILPILMAATMALQSALTPSTGDASQKKIMTVVMPVMMLFMFYSFPAALSLYWTLSQVLSIVQMWMIRRSGQRKQEALMPEVIDPPQTRQMRRHG